MKVTGGCYCGALRYEAEGEPLMRGQCHCRECQYVTGGGPNYFLVMPEAGFTWQKGEPARFRRPDMDNPVTREFCPHCGTHIATRAPGLPGAIIIKVGSMDEPAQYGHPDLAIYLCDKQAFHQIPEGLPAYQRMPGG